MAIIDQISDIDESIFLFLTTLARFFWNFNAVKDEKGIIVLINILMPTSDCLEI